MNEPIQYEERYKDIVAYKIVRDADNLKMEIYGKDLNGRNVWVMIHSTPETKNIVVRTPSEEE